MVRHGVLHLTFEDGLSGEVDVLDQLWGPVFEQVRTPEGFAEVRVDRQLGTVLWPSGADLAPDTLYERLRTGIWPGCNEVARGGMSYYDSDADIAWFPTGDSDDVVSERVPGGLRDYDRTSRRLVAIEVWDASTRLPASILEALPAPSPPNGATARESDAHR